MNEIQISLPRSLEISYLGDWPPEARTAVDETLKTLYDLFPPWLLSFYVRWSDASHNKGGTRTLADICMSYGTRWARLQVYAAFLEGSAIDRKRTLAHELLHITLEPLRSQIGWVVGLLPKDHKPLVMPELDERLEMVTEDLARVFVGLPVKRDET